MTHLEDLTELQMEEYQSKKQILIGLTHKNISSYDSENLQAGKEYIFVSRGEHMSLKKYLKKLSLGYQLVRNRKFDSLASSENDLKVRSPILYCSITKQFKSSRIIPRNTERGRTKVTKSLKLKKTFSFSRESSSKLRNFKKSLTHKSNKINRKSGSEHKLANKGASEELLIHILKQIIMCMDHLNNFGYFHGHLSLESFSIDPNTLSIKLIDFPLPSHNKKPVTDQENLVKQNILALEGNIGRTGQQTSSWVKRTSDKFLNYDLEFLDDSNPEKSKIKDLYQLGCVIYDTIHYFNPVFKQEIHARLRLLSHVYDEYISYSKDRKNIFLKKFENLESIEEQSQENQSSGKAKLEPKTTVELEEEDIPSKSKISSLKRKTINLNKIHNSEEEIDLNTDLQTTLKPRVAEIEQKHELENVVYQLIGCKQDFLRLEKPSDLFDTAWFIHVQRKYKSDFKRELSDNTLTKRQKNRMIFSELPNLRMQKRISSAMSGIGESSAQEEEDEFVPFSLHLKFSKRNYKNSVTRKYDNSLNLSSNFHLPINLF